VRVPAPTDAEILDRAKTYPYALSPRSFVFAGGQARELLGPSGAPLVEARVGLTGRLGSALGEVPGLGKAELAAKVPVLAYGSNAAPAVLARKTARSDFPGPESIVVLRCELHDHDVVFSAHIAAYGAVPATLQASPGVCAHVFLMLLSDGQLAALRATEPNYELVRLPEARVEAEWGVRASAPRAFLSRHGCLEAGGEEVALAAVPATGRRLRAWTGLETLRFAAARLAPERELDDFILESARDPSAPGRRTRELRPFSRPFVGTRRPG